MKAIATKKEPKSYDINLLLKMMAEVGEKIEKITRAETAYAKLVKYADAKQEYFLAMTLNGAHGIINVHEISKGLVNRTMVHPREVFRQAILDNAVAIIVAHNHPSGELQPGPEDREMTKVLYNAGKVVGIEVLDHLILAKKGFYSFQEHDPWLDGIRS